MSVYRVLTVCTANVCRSPAAAVMLKTGLEQAGLADQVEVGSAGTSWEAEGHPIDERTLLSLERAGYRVQEHVARSVVVSELAEWDLVLAMTASHHSTLARKLEVIPGGPAGTELRMWGAFDPLAQPDASLEELDVPDPWYEEQEAFDRVILRIERAVPALIRYIRSQIEERTP